jgi:hypothetical protein
MDARFYGESWFTMLRCQESLNNGHTGCGDESIMLIVKYSSLRPDDQCALFRALEDTNLILDGSMLQ